MIMLHFRDHFLSGTALVLAGFVALSLMVPVAGSAEESRIPTLNGHQFTTNNLTGDPFVRTYIRNSLGLGKALDLFVPVVELGNNEIYGLKGDLINAILEFEFQQAVKDWIAFRTQVRVFGRLGTGTQSLLAQGVTANMGFDIGWMFRLAQGEKTALSGTINVWNNSLTAVDLLGFVDGILDDTNRPLVRKVPTTRGGGGLRYAWAASPLVGFNFLGETGVGESADRSPGDEWFYKFGAAVDFDLKKKTVLPFGVVLGYRLDSFPETGEELSTANKEIVLRIAYTGTTDFLVSLDFTYSWIESGGRNHDYHPSSC
jgi:hypothetical protein